MGSQEYPRARQLLICADSGGRNGYGLRLWKEELQALWTKPVSGQRCVACLQGPPSGTKSVKLFKLFSGGS